MQKYFIILVICFLMLQDVAFSAEKIDAALQYKKYVMQVKRERMTVYNALNLTDEQSAKKEELFCENNEFYENAFHNLIEEHYKLKVLKDSDCSAKEIRNQSKVVNSIKKDIDNRLKNEDKQFKKVLTREQKAKYSLIMHLERLDSNKKETDYYKSNPQLQYFGGN